MTLFVSPAEPRELRNLGRVSPICEKRGVDFLFPSKGKWYGIQRKAIPDLIASMQDGRLAKEIAQMQWLNRALLIVEGKARFTLDGEMITNGYGKGINKAGFHGILWSVQAKGVAVDFTDSLQDTASLIETFVRYSQREVHSALERRPGPDSIWGKPNHREYQLHLVMGIPGVGPELAERIVDELGMPFGWNITVEDLATIKGIGKKKAQQIYACLGEADAG